MDLPELGSDSQAPQTQLGTVEEPVLGSLGHTVARDIKFLVVDTTDTTGCHRRAENRVGTLGWTLVWGGEGKRAGGEPLLKCKREKHRCSQKFL